MPTVRTTTLASLNRLPPIQVHIEHIDQDGTSLHCSQPCAVYRFV